MTNTEKGKEVDLVRLVLLPVIADTADGLSISHCDLIYKNLVEDLSQAGLEITPKDSGWQDIETAVREGPGVSDRRLLYFPHFTGDKVWTGFRYAGEDGWHAAGEFQEIPPTHWQPLPSPPIKQGDEG